MDVSTDFYGGTIDLVSNEPGGDARLRLRRDPRLNFAQGFYFAIAGGDQPRRLIIDNAGQALIPTGWENYEAFASKDDDCWSRTATRYADGELIIDHQPSDQLTYYAYFPPYKPSRHQALLEFCAEDDRATVRDLCSTSPEDKIELISIGNESAAALQAWVIARQHPGEIQASWWIESFIRKLFDHGDAEAAALLARARVHIVPNMNPDGSRLGYYRTNINGQNLNASWDSATMEETPAVHAVLQEMDRIGMHFNMDVHADEELPYAFIASVDRIIPVSAAVGSAHDEYQIQLAAVDPGFRPMSGYVRPHTKSNPLSFCSPYLMKRFDAPSVTLELPFKRLNAGESESPEYGVFGCVRSGRAALAALVRCLDALASLKGMKKASRL